MECVKIENLSFSYPEQSHLVLKDINLCIESGEFITLCGPSGSGKSTLLRQLKTAIAPHGKRKGTIFFNGKPLEEIEQRVQSSAIGFVMQNPDNQIVTDKAWHELAFGLESLGLATSVIRRRVAEMASFFGIQDWYYKDVNELSGGQKQLLNLASVMVMQPSLLILDEPTSQLDPIAAADFINIIGRINRELGTTIIIAEHRLDEVLAYSNRLVVMDRGRIICQDSPEMVGRQLQSQDHRMFSSMPVPMRIYAQVPNNLKCPITVRDGRRWIEELSKERSLKPVASEDLMMNKTYKLDVELSDVWFRYEKNDRDIIKGLSFKAYPGEITAILGGNGTGKSTALSIIAGINKPYRGSVRIKGKDVHDYKDELFKGLLGVVPQNPQELFVKKTVKEDLEEMLSGTGLSTEQLERRVASVASLCSITEILHRHPYDISGGEQQRAALAKVLLLQPRILLLDEPTKGLDGHLKECMAAILKNLAFHGVSVILVSHDIEFCAQYADSCAMFYDGQIVAQDTPKKFFSGNSFYTTAANRMCRQLLPEAVTPEQVIEACGGEPKRVSEVAGESLFEISDEEYYRIRQEQDALQPASNEQPRLWRKIGAAISGIFVILMGIKVLDIYHISFLNTIKTPTSYVLLMLSILVFAICVSGKSIEHTREPKEPLEKKKLTKRTLAAMVIILAAIPCTILFGVYRLGDRKYMFISLLIMLETVVPFFMVFEGRKPQARELIIISVLSAIAAAGRAAFFMLPQFKPVAALVIISGVAFGGEAGFLVGATSMLVSNMLFSQGTWTPWQMFTMGIIGFIAGVLFRKGFLRRDRFSLSAFGALAVIIIYGGIMNPASVIMYQSHITWEMLLASYISGFPMDIVHASATVVFLWFLSEPMLEKLDRIKTKYGLIE